MLCYWIFAIVISIAVYRAGTQMPRMSDTVFTAPQCPKHRISLERYNTQADRDEVAQRNRLAQKEGPLVPGGAELGGAAGKIAMAALGGPAGLVAGAALAATGEALGGTAHFELPERWRCGKCDHTQVGGGRRLPKPDAYVGQALEGVGFVMLLLSIFVLPVAMVFMELFM